MGWIHWGLLYFDETKCPSLELGHTLAEHGGAGLLVSLLLLLVLLDALEEVSAAGGVLHVLDAQVHLLGDNAVANTLVHNHSNSMLCDIEDTPSLAMVELERHTLLDGTIGLDVNNITTFENFHVS